MAVAKQARLGACDQARCTRVPLMASPTSPSVRRLSQSMESFVVATVLARPNERPPSRLARILTRPLARLVQATAMTSLPMATAGTPTPWSLEVEKTSTRGPNERP